VNITFRNLFPKYQLLGYEEGCSIKVLVQFRV